ncbi:Acetolactate synthase large subunit [Geodia barretti]|nr:Acetolactate synthase large subunit [Geodia barretti]
MELSGARILVDSLKREGVEYIFGVNGGAAMPIFDALYGETEIKLIPMRHEQGASHAADGYARATGNVGVALATSGPGATNLVTGIATAYMDSIPMVAITGQVFTHYIGSDAFQECDIIGVTRPICKHSYLIKNSDEVADVVAEAFHIAKTGKPGPVIIDIAKDAQMHETLFQYPETVDIRSYKPQVHGDPTQIAKAAALIKEAKRPYSLCRWWCRTCQRQRGTATTYSQNPDSNYRYVDGPRCISRNTSFGDGDARHAWILLCQLRFYRCRSCYCYWCKVRRSRYGRSQ